MNDKIKDRINEALHTIDDGDEMVRAIQQKFELEERIKNDLIKVRLLLKIAIQELEKMQ